MTVKILFFLITIIPLKLYKVHSILKGSKGDGMGRKLVCQFGLEASSVDLDTAQLGWGWVGTKV